MMRCVFWTLTGLLFSLEAAAFSFMETETASDSSSLLSPRQALNPTYATVDVTGAHAWQAPLPGDQRGPCPGLNAAANHNYIAHNGVVTLEEAVDGVQKAYGINIDMAYLLGVAGVLQCGDGIGFSIGGPLPESLITQLGFGRGLGLSYCHNKFEGDGSPVRGDLYQYGDDYSVQLPLLQGLLDLPVDPDYPDYNISLLGDYSLTRYLECVSQNPYYFRGPVGVFIPPGTFAIASRLFSTFSTEYPDGYLPRENLLSFYSTSESDTDGSLMHTPGHERLPPGFSKKTNGDLYSVPELFLMVSKIFQTHQQEIAFGGNTGTVNSFTGLDVGNMSGGVYNAATLLQGNNLMCFTLQSLSAFMPDLIANAGVIQDIQGAMAKWNNATNNALNGIQCPEITNYNSAPLQQYPGWTKLKMDGTY